MKKNSARAVIRKISTIIGILLCVVLIPILVINLTIVIKSYVYPDRVPDFFGLKLFIVETDSMKPAILGGDLVVTKSVDPAKLVVGDIISFRADTTTDAAVVTHRIEEIVGDGDNLSFVTKGDANNANDGDPFAADLVESIYLFRIGKIGNLAMFIRTPVGMLIFVGIPVFGFIIYDSIFRNIIHVKSTKNEQEALAEIERLKAELKKRDEEAEADEEQETPPDDDKDEKAPPEPI